MPDFETGLGTYTMALIGVILNHYEEQGRRLLRKLVSIC